MRVSKVPYATQAESWQQALGSLREFAEENGASRDTLVQQTIFDDEVAAASLAEAFAEWFEIELEMLPEKGEDEIVEAMQRMEAYKRIAYCPMLLEFVVSRNIYQSFVRAVSRIHRGDMDPQKVKSLVWASCDGFTR